MTRCTQRRSGRDYANFALTEFSERQRRCVGMGGASSPRFLRSTRSMSHATVSRSAAILSVRSSRVRSTSVLVVDPTPAL